jgi:hypothetical protein
MLAGIVPRECRARADSALQESRAAGADASQIAAASELRSEWAIGAGRGSRRGGVPDPGDLECFAQSYAVPPHDEVEHITFGAAPKAHEALVVA